MSWLSRFWLKPVGVSAHIGWGLAIGTWTRLLTGDELVTLLVPLGCGLLWEAVPEAILRTLRQIRDGGPSWLSRALSWAIGPNLDLAVQGWRARAWDVVPWFIGALLAALSFRVLPGA